MQNSARRNGDKHIYARIAELRTERGISRRELADGVGVHLQTIGYLERQEFSPSLPLALRIAEFFGLPVEAVFSLHPPRKLSTTPPPS